MGEHGENGIAQRTRDPQETSAGVKGRTRDTRKSQSRSYLQHTRARGADERADRHVNISRPALVAVEAFFVARLRDQFAKRLQVPLVLLPLRRRHPVRTSARAHASAAGTGLRSLGRRNLPRVGREAVECGRSPGTRDRANHLSRRACRTDCDASLLRFPRSLFSLSLSLSLPRILSFTPFLASDH